MKKVSLLSLIAALTIGTGVSAGTENPLYRPSEGKAYSITEVLSTKDGNDEDMLRATETFGYGFSNKFSVFGSVDYRDQDSGDDGFGNIDIGLSYRYLTGGTLGDVYGKFGTNIDKDVAGKYNAYTVGTKVGTTSDKYTIAGKLEYEIKDWDADDEEKILRVGIDGLYAFAPKFSGLLGFEYEDTDEADVDESIWTKVEAYWLASAASTVTGFYHTDISGDAEDRFGLRYGVQF
jgi:hypothetical protein